VKGLSENQNVTAIYNFQLTNTWQWIAKLLHTLDVCETVHH